MSEIEAQSDDDIALQEEIEAIVQRIGSAIHGEVASSAFDALVTVTALLITNCAENVEGVTAGDLVEEFSDDLAKIIVHMREAEAEGRH